MNNRLIVLVCTYREDEAVGSKLLTVTATDLDTGLNGDIRYIIRSGDPNEDLWLDSHRGDLYVQRRLDYERKNQYELEVVAQDLGNPQGADTASVTLTITDVNDNAPQVTETHGEQFPLIIESPLIVVPPLFFGDFSFEL